MPNDSPNASFSFALIGNHSDGLRLTRELTQRGHSLTAYAGPEITQPDFSRLISQEQRLRDVEQLLARRDLDLIIVADELEHRQSVLRRAVQSERHVVCVHPPGHSLDTCYEVGMIRNDTKKVLLPALKHRFLPGLDEMRAILQTGSIGKIHSVSCDHLLRTQHPALSTHHSALETLWDSLRQLGGEISEVTALSSGSEELRDSDEITLGGKFTTNSLFQVAIARKFDFHHRITVEGESGKMELRSDSDTFGPACLTLTLDSKTEVREYEVRSPWAALTNRIESALSGQMVDISWLDSVRCLELLDAAKTSVKKSRAVPMYYQDFSETSTFKGTMAAAGCGLIWLVLFMALLGPMFPWMWYMIPVILIGFLGLQLFGWALPRAEKSNSVAQYRS